MTRAWLKDFDPDVVPLRSALRTRLAVGQYPDGSFVEIPLTVLSGSKRHPRVLLTAGLHGDEFEGPRALARLARRLRPADLSGTVVILPLLNPPAFNAGGRSSPIDGQNLNRMFPGSQAGSFSERLAHDITHSLFPGTDLLADFHTGGTRLLHAPLAGYYAGTSDVNRLSFRAARALGLPYLWSLPPRRGVLSYEAIEAGIPAIGAELGGGGRCAPDNVVLYEKSVVNLLQVWEVLPGSIATYPQQLHVTGDWLQSPVSGVLENHTVLEQAVKAGQKLATIYDFDDAQIGSLTAPYDGLVLGLRTYPAVYTGDPAAFVLAEGDVPVTPAAV